MTVYSPELNFDPFSPGPREDRASLFATVREAGPVYHTESDLWVVTGFDDVKAVQSHPDVFSSRPNPYDGSATQATDAMDPDVLERILQIAADMPVDLAELGTAQAIASADAPEHTRLRRIVSRGFTPARIAKLSTAIEEIIDRCLADAGDLDGFDIVEGLAVPLPVEMIANILGIEDAGYAQVKQWSDSFAASGVGDIRNSVEGQLQLLTALRGFAAFYVPLIEARRSDPKDDVVSTMVRAVDNEALSTAETLTTAVTIMVAGNETSTNLIGNTVVELLRNPDQLRLIIEDPSLVAAAVDEANRLTTPIQFAFREATVDTEIAGNKIPKGGIVVLHMAAANRDPLQFDDADHFLVNRPRERNLAFGHGVHFCLGSHLALQEVTAAVGRVAPYLDQLRLGDEPLEANPSAILNGWQKVVLARR